MNGWKCPGCGYCYSPSMLECRNCNRPDHEKYSTSTTATITTDVTTSLICLCTKDGPGYTPGSHCDKCGGLIVNYTVTA